MCVCTALLCFLTTFSLVELMFLAVFDFQSTIAVAAAAATALVCSPRSDDKVKIINDFLV